MSAVSAPRVDTPWWRSAVFYQVYPRSFADGNGDGIGDLTGLTSRLDYLTDVGVDALWLSPFYRSPMADGGYDVSDPCDVDPIFGTLADFDRLVEAVHARGMRITVDIDRTTPMQSASVVSGGARRTGGQPRTRAVHLSGRPRRARRAATEQLALSVRRAGLATHRRG